MRKILVSLATVATLLLVCLPNNTYAFEKKDFRKELTQSLDHGDVISEIEPNDNFFSADYLVMEEVYGGTISSNDVDYFQVNVTEKGYFFTTGIVYGTTSWIQATIYGSNGEVVSTDSETVDDMFFSGAVLLEPGNYYVKLTPKPGIPYEQEYLFASMLVPSSFYRLSGVDRYETSVEIAYDGWGYSANEVILSTGQDFPDALAAGPLANQLDAPILLTKKDQLPNAVVDYIYDSNVSKVTIIGGTGVVSAKVEQYLKTELGVKVERIAGKDRFDTAAQISDRLVNYNGDSTAYVVNGRNFPDALSIAPIAAREGAPILLVESNSIPTTTSNKLKKYKDTFVIGGKGAVSETLYKKLSNPTRISGADRYETSAKVAEYFYDPAQKGHFEGHSAYIATGSNFADALTGSVNASFYGEPLLLTPSTYLHPSVKSFIEEYDYMWFTILGGNSAVSDDVVWDLLNLPY